MINKYIVVYIDDVTIYSKQINHHLSHIGQIFYHCRKYGISLNPKKANIVVTKGNFLGFVVSKNGIEIAPERTKIISQISFPHK